jgi:aspartate/methionine/tyrosine aminotransferase
LSARRLGQIAGFSIDRVAAAAGADPAVLRLENLDTDVPPPPEAIVATKEAVGLDETNSWLPFTGRDDLKAAVAASIERRGGPSYDPARQVVITSGEGDAMLDALFVLTDPGDEVILTDPTYAGMVNRVRLVGARPRFVPLDSSSGEWRLDLDALRRAADGGARVVFVNNASFPSGWVASPAEWAAIAELCASADLWLLYWGGFEAVLYDGRGIIHPAALPGMGERTVIVGSPTFEQRMIGWRIGWVVVPEALLADASRVQIYNGLVPSGHNQVGVRVALELEDDGLGAANAEWQVRRDEVVRQLAGLPATPAAGGWSMLLDAAALGVDPSRLSERLLEHKVAATPMGGWGAEVAARHVRFVFSNEPASRLTDLRARLLPALEESL